MQKGWNRVLKRDRARKLIVPAVKAFIKLQESRQHIWHTHKHVQQQNRTEQRLNICGQMIFNKATAFSGGRTVLSTNSAIYIYTHTYRNKNKSLNSYLTPYKS